MLVGIVVFIIYVTIWEHITKLICHSFNAGAASDKGIFCFAFRAMFGLLSLKATMVASKASAMTVLDKPGRTIAACFLMAASLTQGKWCIAAAIEK